MSSVSSSRFAILLLTCLLPTGCSDVRLPQVEAGGKILFADGNPLPAGTTVLLNPTEGGVGTASGKTEVDGSFVLTHVSGSGGPEVGKYTVKLLAPEGDRDFYKKVPSDVVNGDVLVAEIQEGMRPLELTVPRAGKRRGR
jgi:hypothetical protein